ncbi:ABC transporter F family member 4 [Musca domestica]|uniref:ABC transporter F family member 4 n=1 Tax=Musca domestica TaxID=7370 RepID=A0A9J7CYU2_MUSDO|nr:ABC transporter F family member 4 [Musca domestica]
MHKTKKKTAKIPKPIKIKKEKTDEDRMPQSMMYYIDDRLELVKQIFGSLKPKTIMNLAPEFLKTQSLEEIEEACLNELLCISTKRLKSIITATKCPTDTESSEDEDVQRKEEHVSLEEISSDSEIEGGTSKKGKKKKASKLEDKNKAGAKNDPQKSAEKNEEEGQISVLELLELQARARAIRSQLALEPVTKIEVDSDKEDGPDRDEQSSSKKSKKPHKSDKNERKRTSSTRESQDSSNNISRSSDKESETRKTKKVKLKRNYRNSSAHNNEDEEGEKTKSTETTANETSISKDNDASEKRTANSSSQQESVEKIKKEKASRSPSPDVIPIVAEPETLLINDSSDEETGKNRQTDESAKIEEPLQKEGGKDRKISEMEDGEVDEYGEGREKTSNKFEQQPEKEDESNNVNEATENDKDKHQEESMASEDSSVKDQEKETKVLAAEEEYEDRNDDVISLGEDLEDEMDEQLENITKADNMDKDSAASSSPAKSKKKKYSEEKNKTEDNQSWHDRYMKSSKVSKVLAASRLGKKVRDKIKKSKEAPRESSDKAEEKEEVFTSKHEEGSLEQYKELLELRQRKSK